MFSQLEHHRKQALSTAGPRSLTSVTARRSVQPPGSKSRLVVRWVFIFPWRPVASSSPPRLFSVSSSSCSFMLQWKGACFVQCCTNTSSQSVNHCFPRPVGRLTSDVWPQKSGIWKLISKCNWWRDKLGWLIMINYNVVHNKLLVWFSFMCRCGDEGRFKGEGQNTLFWGWVPRPSNFPMHVFDKTIQPSFIQLILKGRGGMEPIPVMQKTSHLTDGFSQLLDSTSTVGVAVQVQYKNLCRLLQKNTPHLGRRCSAYTHHLQETATRGRWRVHRKWGGYYNTMGRLSLPTQLVVRVTVFSGSLWRDCPVSWKGFTFCWLGSFAVSLRRLL